VKLFDEDYLDVIAAYQAAEQDLAGAGHRVKLLGTARKGRPCPACHKPIVIGAPIVNYGQVSGFWKWICLGCTPENPLTLPHVKSVLGAALVNCQECKCLFIAGSSESTRCFPCIAESECTGEWRTVSYGEVLCCGYCNECGAGKDCENCEEHGEEESPCCGSCENCTRESLMWTDYCGYCERGYWLEYHASNPNS
jgi:hypothetical protein